ncbi:zonadhesin-like [Gadus macrocephalus]|uniref:zonadhesin-like n=1 Tax=Gadus macrocephalus TaxID=80720 RepID=UPI0028CB9515|nr:zonadhesin-like [Gadus macrocephalus]
MSVRNKEATLIDLVLCVRLTRVPLPYRPLHGAPHAGPEASHALHRQAQADLLPLPEAIPHEGNVRHISILSDGDTPTINKCTNRELFHCPFCKYVGAKYMVDNHIKGHSSVKHEGFTMIKCGLSCRTATHFHCCYCTATIINRLQFTKHLLIHQGEGHAAAPAQHSVAPVQQSVAPAHHPLVPAQYQEAAAHHPLAPPAQHPLAPTQHPAAPTHHPLAPTQHPLAPAQPPLPPPAQHPLAPTHHPEAPTHHPEAPTHHPEAPTHHPEAPTHHPEAPTHHPEAPTHHPEAPTHHPEAPTHHPEAPTHHPEAPTHHPEAPTHHTQAPAECSAATKASSKQNKLCCPHCKMILSKKNFKTHCRRKHPHQFETDTWRE